MLDAKLIVIGGDAKATVVQLKLPTVIGRGRESTLALPHPLVSRRHTEIFERDGQLIVRDLGSLNGTFVNNKKIEDEQVLAPNQLLTLGNVTFRAVYESAAFPQTDDSMPEIEVSAKTAQPAHEADSGDALLETTTLPPEQPPAAADEQPPAAADARRSTIEISGTPAESTSGRAEAKTEPAADSRIEQKAEAKTKKADANTADHDTSSSQIFVEGSEAPPEHSIAVENLDGLPSAAAAASFVGNLDLDDVASPAADVIDPAALQFGGVADQPAVDPEQSGLGSFLKKLPR